MYPANEFVKVVYHDRLRAAENARLARSEERGQPQVQLRRRNRIRALVLRLLPRRAPA